MSKDRVLQTLLRIKSGEIEIRPHSSICHNLTAEGILWFPLLDVVTPLFKTWEHFSGDDTFPIPSTNKKYDNPQSYYYSTKSFWRGKQGKLRWSLIDHMITCLENEK